MQIFRRTSHSTVQAPPPECVADQRARLIDGRVRIGVGITERCRPSPKGDRLLTDDCRRRCLTVRYGNRDFGNRRRSIFSTPPAQGTREQFETWVNEGGAGHVRWT